MNRDQLTAWRAAAQQFGGIYRATPGPQGWAFNTYDQERRAWWLPVRTTTYGQAVVWRAEAIADAALLQRFGRCDVTGDPIAETRCLGWNTTDQVRREYVRAWRAALDQSPL